MEKKELPVEVAKKIEQEAERYADKYLNGVVNTREHALLAEAYASGATTCATNLHKAEEKIKELERQNEKMKAMATGWRPLLEDILRDNNNGYIDIDEALCSRIKKFLYGE